MLGNETQERVLCLLAMHTYVQRFAAAAYMQCIVSENPLLACGHSEHGIQSKRESGNTGAAMGVRMPYGARRPYHHLKAMHTFIIVIGLSSLVQGWKTKRAR